MRFIKMVTENFQGLSGVRTFDLSKKITVNIASNGSGKTSFLNAIRYCLTGAEPSGDIITYGMSRMSVTLFAEDGVAFTRMKSVKGNQCFINKKPTTITAFTEMINKGVAAKDTRIVSSSEVIASLRPKDLEEFLLGFVNETDKRDAFAGIQLSQDAAVVIEHEFPGTVVSINEINRFYKKYYDKRTSLKKELTSEQAILNVLAARGGHTAAMRTREEIEAEIALLKQKEAENIAAKEAIKHYNDAFTKRTEQLQQINEIKRTLEGINTTAVSQDDIDAIRKEMEELRQKRESLCKQAAVYQSTISSLKKALKSLGDSICPLSEKIVCTTDKTGLKVELQQSLTATEEAYGSVSAELLEIEKQILQKETDYNRLLDNKALVEKKIALEAQLAQAQRGLTMLPQKPTVEASESLNGRLDSLTKELLHFNDYMEYLRVYQEYITKKTEYTCVEELLRTFNASGPVKANITNTFIKKFEDACNVRAAAFQQMSFQFLRSEKGIEMKVCPKKGADLISFGSLSGGEKAKALFVLMDVFAAISGFRILLLDELSVLDIEGLTGLLQVIVSKQEDYDHVFLNAVDYTDIYNVLAKFNLHGSGNVGQTGKNYVPPKGRYSFF